ncbi:hypothetical protein GBAR_LOCUS14692 [Geodia barretti]|uniref:Death domain-containing protein n=1 Tax=Geodia barretti TaxID=519541 RepID=A0AA35WM33_GEOBA|nr:hypothetical protein GBAR_LOCUS14692 [Geodia barretti]
MAELPACDVIENDEVHLKSTLLHTGRYATVREADIAGAKCAAKIFNFSDGERSPSRQDDVVCGCKDPPNNILPQTYTNESKQLICRSEIERCSQSMEKIFRELGKEHPLGKLITSCLNQQLASRPTAANLVETHSLLWQAAVLIPDPFQEKTKVDLVHHTHNLACAHVRMRRELESHDCEQRDQIRGLLQGMARQREMLPTEDGEEEDKEMVSEQEIAYIANFVEGIQADKLGRELGVCESTLEIINCESANRCDENRKRANVLRQWLRNTSSPTWEALVKALGSIGQKRVADILRNDKGLQYCTTITERGSEQSQAELRKVGQCVCMTSCICFGSSTLSLVPCTHHF